MSKHLIIHGDGMSGKTLFIKSFLNKHFTKHKTLDCRTLNIHDKIDVKYFELNEAVYFMGVNMRIPPEYFYQYATIPKGAKIVIEYSEEIKTLSDAASFTRRFDVINTNKISYKDLTTFLNNKQ